MTRLADHGASVVHAPTSNMRFGSGLARIRAMLENMKSLSPTRRRQYSDSLNNFEAARLASLLRVLTPDYANGWQPTKFFSWRPKAVPKSWGGVIQ